MLLLPDDMTGAPKPIKWYRSLATRKGRVKAGAFLVEGERAINQIADSSPDAIMEIVSTEEASPAYSEYPRRVVTEGQMESISSTRTPQGIVAVVRLPRATYSDRLPDDAGGNILVDGRGEVAALLDFDEAHESHLILDVAAFLQYWCYDLEHGLDVAAAAEAIGHYHRLRPLTQEEMDCLRSAILLNLAADASDYLAGRIVAGDTGVSVHSCHSYRRFSTLRATQDWETYVLRRADD